jgi:hypothetical protein
MKRPIFLFQDVIMMAKYMANTLCLVLGLLGVLSCGGGENNSETADVSKPAIPATVNFFNESSFKVDIYKNMNPEYFDPTTLVCTVNDGATVSKKMYASGDQVIGDTFYPRYKVLLANSLETDTSNIYVDAQRDMSNISFVIEEGKTYTKTIPQPLSGQLRFINGYLKIQNQGTYQIQIIQGDAILQRLDNQTVYIVPGKMGYYEIPLSYFDNTLAIDSLQAFSSSSVTFPSFVMSRGKLYSFTVNGNTVSDPIETTISY